MQIRSSSELYFIIGLIKVFSAQDLDIILIGQLDKVRTFLYFQNGLLIYINMSDYSFLL